MHTSAELPTTSMPLKTISMLFSFTLNEQETSNEDHMLSLRAINNMQSQMRTSHSKAEVWITFVHRCPPTTKNIHLAKCVMWEQRIIQTSCSLKKNLHSVKQEYATRQHKVSQCYTFKKKKNKWFYLKRFYGCNLEEPFENSCSNKNSNIHFHIK